MKSAPRTVSLIGWSGDGKTRFASRLIAHYRRQGYHVAAVKKSGGPVEVDRQGSDSDLFRQSGAAETALLAPEQSVLFYSRMLSEEELQRQFAGADLVVAEGLPFGEGPLVEVAGGKAAREGLKSAARSYGRRINAFLLTDSRAESRLPREAAVLTEGDFTEILEYLEERWNGKQL